MSNLVKWFPDNDGGYYKADSADKVIAKLEQENQALRDEIDSYHDENYELINSNYVPPPKEPADHEKGLLHGEFFVYVNQPCLECFEDDEVDDECFECFGEGIVPHKEVIPWTTIKDIRKAIIQSQELVAETAPRKE